MYHSAALDVRSEIMHPLLLHVPAAWERLSFALAGGLDGGFQDPRHDNMRIIRHTSGYLSEGSSSRTLGARP